jgi:hypothetical protein
MSLLLAPTIHGQARSSFDLPAQPLAASLRAVASQTDTNVLFDPPLVEGRVAPALKAQITLDQAFLKLLTGTGLTYKYLDDKTVTIIAASGAGSAQSSANGSSGSSEDANTNKEAGKKSSQDFRVAQVDQGAAGPSSVNNAKETEAPSQKKSAGLQEKDDLEEIIVTGTHLRGVTDTGSSLQLITADDIQRAGIATVAEIVQLIPQAFGGLVTDNTFGSINGGSGNNFTAGTGIDLRGLGPTSTLVLVNGRRLAPSNAQFEGYTDISAIPLAAVDRVEIVADGASAIYGSDAVGGVVNFILKRNFEGDTRGPPRHRGQSNLWTCLGYRFRIA